MKKLGFTLALMAVVIIGNAQVKKVLLEEFSGAKCGNCPMGSYMVDSMVAKFPNVIGVALHAYKPSDAMFFAQIDTIGMAYAGGAPLGAIDRIYNGTFGAVAFYHSAWNAAIVTELAKTPPLTVSISPSWNSGTRNITAAITSSILTNITSGDYRFNLYVVEDSVTGTGTGYNQSNYYNGVNGNPFFGLGDPIIGYVHKHVVRAILPQAWGKAGIIAATPTAGQLFTYTVNYTLPVTVNENRVSLVAFVSKYTTNHQGDDVLNAEQVKLPVGITNLHEFKQEDMITLYPNPTTGKICFNKNSSEVSKVEIFNTIGVKVLELKVEKNETEINLSELKAGTYFLYITLKDGKSPIKKFIVEK